MPDPRDGAAGSALDGARLVVGLTGSIAAYKGADLIRRLGRAGATVQPVMTPAATRFVSPLTVGALAGRPVPVSMWPTEAGDDPGGTGNGWTAHVSLGVWADGIVVAPCTAQTLAALAHGHCDTLLAAVVLSARCPVLVAPAMDHDMWRHPATQRNVARLRADGVTVVEPASGALASGLTGEGRLPEPEDLVEVIAGWLADHRRRRGTLAGRHVLVTAGPTREAIDPVRFLSNGSTGTMGFEIAAEAARRGARVTLVAGPVALATPPGVDRRDVTTADEMLAACEDAYADGPPDLVIAAAAVGDYTAAEPSAVKLKKSDDDLVLRLRRTPDVLATLGARRTDAQTLVGFALETHDGERHARAKLAAKHLDWVVLNDALAPGEGFGPATNRVVLLAANGRRVDVPLASKREVAAAILDAVAP